MLLLLSAAFAQVNPDLTPAQERQLRAGEVVLLDGEPVDGVRLRTVGVVDISAPADAVWSSLFDLSARVEESASIKRAEVYDSHPGAASWGVRWEVSLIGVGWIFHQRYHRISDTHVEIVLDDEQDNDLAFVSGSYTVLPTPAGTRFIYVSDTEPGGVFGGSLARVVARELTSNLLEDIAERAEG